jgi:hypothetical protein
MSSPHSLGAWRRLLFAHDDAVTCCMESVKRKKVHLLDSVNEEGIKLSRSLFFTEFSVHSSHKQLIL